jgi:hypothetical protein
MKFLDNAALLMREIKWNVGVDETKRAGIGVQAKRNRTGKNCSSERLESLQSSSKSQIVKVVSV